MRAVSVSTIALSAALVLGALTAPAYAAEPGPRWQNGQAAGPDESYAGFAVAPDGYAVVHTSSHGSNDSADPAHTFTRARGGSWTIAPEGSVPTEPVFDDASNGWGLIGSGTVVTVGHRPAGGAWSSGPSPLGALQPGAQFEGGGLVLTDAGVPVVWRSSALAGDFTLDLATRTDSGWDTITRTTDGFAAVTAGVDGSVRAAWPRAADLEVIVSDRRPDGSWTADEPISVGRGSVRALSWIGPHALNVGFAAGEPFPTRVAGETTNGPWDLLMGPSTVHGSYGGPRDLATLTWTSGGQVHVLPQGSGGWGEATILGEGAEPMPAVDDRGNVTVVFAGRAMDVTSPNRYALRPVNGSWQLGTLPKAVSALGFDDALHLGVDDQGTVTLAAAGTRDGKGGLYTADLVTPSALTTITVQGYRSWSEHYYLRLDWRTSWDTATAHDVRYRVTHALRPGVTNHAPYTGITAPTASIPRSDGATYCFRARAHLGSDPTARTGPWSERSCITSPIDDKRLAVDRHWRRASGETRTSTRGATLALRNVTAKRFALLLDPSSRGTVVVSFAGKRLGTFDLAHKAGSVHRIVGLGRFPTARRGDLVVRVVSKGEPVRIEGVYAER